MVELILKKLLVTFYVLIAMILKCHEKINFTTRMVHTTGKLVLIYKTDINEYMRNTTEIKFQLSYAVPRI